MSWKQQSGKAAVNRRSSGSGGERRAQRQIKFKFKRINHEDLPQPSTKQQMHHTLDEHDEILSKDHFKRCFVRIVFIECLFKTFLKVDPLSVDTLIMKCYPLFVVLVFEAISEL